MKLTEKSIDDMVELSARLSDLQASRPESERWAGMERVIEELAEPMERLRWLESRCPDCGSLNWLTEMQLRHGGETDCETCKRGVEMHRKKMIEGRNPPFTFTIRRDTWWNRLRCLVLTGRWPRILEWRETLR